VARKDDVWPPRKQFVAHHSHHATGLVRVAPTAMENVLILKAKVPGKGNTFAAQLRRINGQIKTISSPLGQFGEFQNPTTAEDGGRRSWTEDCDADVIPDDAEDLK
jgi:hypothetical protein